MRVEGQLEDESRVLSLFLLLLLFICSPDPSCEAHLKAQRHTASPANRTRSPGQQTSTFQRPADSTKMDQVPLPDWAAHILGDHYQTYQTYSPYARQAWSLISTARSYAFLLIDQVSRKPDLATIALLLVVIFISLKVLDILWQTLMFWVRMVRRLVFWGGLVVLAMWMWTRGPEGVAEDVGYWVGVWRQEKDHWVEKERVARMAGQRQAAMGAGRGGNGAWW